MAVSLAEVTSVLACLSVAAAFWQDDLIPRRYEAIDERSILKFSGNLSHKDHFRLLEEDGSSLLIGARNVVYNISLADFTERREERLQWPSEERDVHMCLMKGLDAEACHNYIRVLAKRGDDELFVCGTNSYKPKCRIYKKNADLGYVVKGGDRDGRGLCPYDPNHNSTVTFVGQQTYAGTVADFAGSDPLIYRDKRPLRTEQYELKQLNAPNFVGSMDYGDHVYFFFRETAVEYMNCGKRAYSRVARVCKGDKGGDKKFKNRWTSFLKSRLNCSIPGEYPFYFDEIQSVSTVQRWVDGDRTEEIIYAIFTTPANSIPGSAVCAFRMSDITDTFNGPFKGQRDMNSNWLPLKNTEVPKPRPGQCVNDSRRLLDIHLNFVQSHALMDSAVPSLHGQPLLARTSLRHRLTKIAVDPQVAAADGNKYDVLFIGTDNGRVLKAVNVASGSSPAQAEPVIIEELDVFPGGSAVTNLLVSRQPGAPPRLIVVSDAEVRALPLHRCGDKAVRCSTCVRLQDPYCGWESAGQRCAPIGSPSWPEGIDPVQSVSHGVHKHCPPTEQHEATSTTTTASPPTPASTAAAVPCDCGAVAASTAPSLDPSDPHTTANKIEPKDDRELYNAVEYDHKDFDPVEQSKSFPLGQATGSQQARGASDAVYTAEALAVAVVVTCLLSMLIGFVGGWLFSRRFSRMRGEPYYGTPHLDQQTKAKQIVIDEPIKPDNRGGDISTMTLPKPEAFTGNNGKQINLLVSEAKDVSERQSTVPVMGYDTLQKKRAMYL